MIAEPLASTSPLILPYEGTQPQLGSHARFFGKLSSVLGRVEIGSRVSMAASAVIRADGHFVRIGDDFSLGNSSTVHIAHDLYPTIIGDSVTVGRNAVVHACTIGNDCVIEDDVVILDGSIVEDEVVVEAGSTVFPRSKLARGLVYAGHPAKPIRELESHQRLERASRLREAALASLSENCQESLGGRLKIPETVLVAHTARLSGQVQLGDRSSIFFSCDLRTEDDVIAIGANTNIQDNSLVHSTYGPINIGEDTTIGHNVRIYDSRIGARSLVGIGSVLKEGTIVESDVLVAAGTTTTPGQILESGWLWGGRPARPIAKLDDAKRAMMRIIVTQYCAYGEAYRREQDLSR